MVCACMRGQFNIDGGGGGGELTYGEVNQLPPLTFFLGGGGTIVQK